MDVVDPVREDEGWAFTPEKPECTPDTVNGTDYLRDVYTKADPTFTGRVTVPVLWDRERETIVSNESADIIRMFNSAFDDVGAAEGDYYPEDLRESIDEINETVYHKVNNGVYKAGFATTQEAYEEAVIPLFETLEAAVEAARAQAGPDPGAQLAASGAAYVFFAADHPALFRLMFGPRQADDTVRAAGLSAFDALVRVVQDGMESGAFRPGDARATAFTAWSLVHGMAQLAIDRTGPLTPEDRVEIADRLRASHTVMMDGLRPR